MKIDYLNTEGYKSEIGQSLLDEISPVQSAQTLNQMLMAVRIADAIKAKGWSKSDFASRMGKKPSEISRWLSGTHNFEMNTLSHIQVVLEVQLLQVEEQKPTVRAKVRYEPKVLVA